ncbi:MAG TPA: hypothetical protein VKR58_15125 [Aquella sp.]|nr:hypothetical protein [Aquella sp.]
MSEDFEFYQKQKEDFFKERIFYYKNSSQLTENWSEDRISEEIYKEWGIFNPIRSNNTRNCIYEIREILVEIRDILKKQAKQ